MVEKERPLPGQEQRPQQKKLHNQNNLNNFDSQGLTTIQQAATQYLGFGFSVIPVNADKTPAVPTWKKFQEQALSTDKVRSVFRNGCSLALVCGAVSGNLECLDFDKAELFKPYMEMLEEINPKLTSKLVKCGTPSGGFHLIYRCQTAVTGNQKLAMSDDLKETWIETRGEGGYFLATPSQGYSIIDGSLKNRQVLTKNERETLHTLARSFTAKLEPSKFDNADKASSTRPGDEYNRRANESVWRDLLESEGWVFTGKQSQGREHLTRPGKNKGTSATLKDGCLYVFSSNAGLPLGPNDAFGIYTWWFQVRSAT